MVQTRPPPFFLSYKMATRMDMNTILTSDYRLKKGILLVCSLDLARYFSLIIKADIWEKSSACSTLIKQTFRIRLKSEYLLPAVTKGL